MSGLTPRQGGRLLQRAAEKGRATLITNGQPQVAMNVKEKWWAREIELGSRVTAAEDAREQ